MSKIIVICEGATEVAFRQVLTDYLKRKYEQANIAENRIGLSFRSAKGKIIPERDLKADVETHLSKPDIKAVIILSDVYPDYSSAQEAKKIIRTAIGDEKRCFIHVACHDFEAWLLPFWSKICGIIGQNKQPFSAQPETVNDINPPSKRLKELFRTAKPRPLEYTKPSQAFRILRGEDIEVSARACPELKSFLNTILDLADLEKLQ